MAQSSDGTPPATGLSSGLSSTEKLQQTYRARRALIDSFKLRANEPAGGQTMLMVSASIYQRLRRFRAKLGMMVRVSEDGVSFGAAIGTLLDLYELLGGDLGGALSWEEFGEIAKAYPYRGRKATRPKVDIPREISRDPRSPIALVRDEHGAVFTYGHRWKLGRLVLFADNPHQKFVDYCTKCGERRYDGDEMPHTKPCPFALEPDDFVGLKLQHQRQKSPELNMDWAQPDAPRLQPAKQTATPVERDRHDDPGSSDHPDRRSDAAEEEGSEAGQPEAPAG